MKKAIVLLLIIAIAFIGVVSAFIQEGANGANPFDGKAPETGKADPPVDGPSLPDHPTPEGGVGNAPPFGDSPPPFGDSPPP